MSSTLTPQQIDDLLAKMNREKQQRREAQQRYKAKPDTKASNNLYMRDYRKKKKEEYEEILKILNDKPAQIEPNKIACECGSIITKGAIVSHRKSQKHLRMLQEINTSLSNN